MNPNAYPYFPDGTPVNPNYLQQIINLPQGNYHIVGTWHNAFELWAYQNNIHGGRVAHFNVQQQGGPMLHVYYNAYGQLEVVGLGQRPAGY